MTARFHQQLRDLTYAAIYFIVHYYFQFWNPSVIFAGFLLATAVVIFICLKVLNKENQ